MSGLPVPSEFTTPSRYDVILLDLSRNGLQGIENEVVPLLGYDKLLDIHLQADVGRHVNEFSCDFLLLR